MAPAGTLGRLLYADVCLVLDMLGVIANRQALVLHTAINFWPSVVPVLPTAVRYRAYTSVLAMRALLALGLMARQSVVRLSGGCVDAKP
jgi:predicted secreted protein